MKRIVLTSAIVLGLAAPAFANSQLEKTLGVDAGVYSLSQLVALKDAAEKTDNEGRLFFGTASGMSSKGSAVGVDLSALEQSVGATPGAYSLSELVQIKDAAEKTDNEGRIFLSDNSVSASAEARIAAFAARVAEEARDND